MVINIKRCLHFAILADHSWYRDAQENLRRSDYRVDSIIFDTEYRRQRSINDMYMWFFGVHPAAESIKFVVGSETVEMTVEIFPHMKLVKSLRGSGRTDQAGLKLLKEHAFEPTVAKIRDGFEEWKMRHPRVMVPQIEIVFPTSI